MNKKLEIQQLKEQIAQKDRELSEYRAECQTLNAQIARIKRDLSEYKQRHFGRQT